MESEITANQENVVKVTNYKFRVPTRIVSILHIVLAIFAILFFLFLFILAVFGTIPREYPSEDPSYNSTSFTDIQDKLESVTPEGISQHSTWVLWLITVAHGLLAGLEFTAAIKLFRATAKIVDPPVAVARGEFWSNVTCIVAIVEVALGIRSRAYIQLAIELCCRAAFLFVGWAYIKQIREDMAKKAVDIPVAVFRPIPEKKVTGGGE